MKRQMTQRSIDRFAITALTVFLGASSMTRAETPYTIEWGTQLGTAANDFSFSVAVDGVGNSYISGRTLGDLDGNNAGVNDAFLAKFDASGLLVWTKQLGTSSHDHSYSVAVDGAGRIYVSGFSAGNLAGINAGTYDAFLAKYDPNGNQLWSEQLGTTEEDYCQSVAVDGAGNAYISGYTKGSLGGTIAGGEDAFLIKYDPAGTLLWSEQLGTALHDRSYSVAIDAAGNAFIGGYTVGNLGGTNAGAYDTFLAKYDPNGTQLWTQQLGTSASDLSFALAVDGAGNALISGITLGDLDGNNAGSSDAYVAKFDPTGTLLWAEQLGTPAIDESWSVAADAAGNVFVGGHTNGVLEGASAGGTDIFLAKYGPTGNLLWIDQLGTSAGDFNRGVTVDGAGNVYVTGETFGSLMLGISGGSDAYLIKYAVPEPATLMMLAMGGVAIIRRRKA